MYYYNIVESGKRLKELRQGKGKTYTQERVAEEVGITREHHSRIETGDKGCSVDLLIILAQYYNVTIDYITYGKVESVHLSEKMDRLPADRRILAEKLINSILDSLL